jgi:hypothetical protein
MRWLWHAWLSFCRGRFLERVSLGNGGPMMLVGKQFYCLLLLALQDWCVPFSRSLFFRIFLLVPFWGIVFASCRPVPVAPTKREASAGPSAPQARTLTPAEEHLEREEESKREAVATYPELGVAGTAVNREYVRRYKLYRSVNPSFFDEPNWPKRLAEMLAQDLGLDPRR